MTFGQSLVAHWYYHIPNLVLLALSGLLVARLALSLLVARDSGGRVMRWVEIATDPVLRPVAAITPKVVPGWLVMVLAVVWLLAIRMALFVAVTATGARLSMA